MRNQIFTVGVALLLVLAGCVGAPVDSATTTPGGGSGGSDGGAGEMDDADDFAVTDAEAALREAGSFTSTWSLSLVDAEGRASEFTNVYYVDIGANRTSETFAVTGDGEGASYERFIADGTSYTRFGDGNDVVYQVFPTDDNHLEYALTRGTSFAYDDFEDATLVGTETFDGATVERYEYTDPMLWRQYGAGTFGTEQNVTITDFTLVVLVDGDGIARSSGWELVGETETGERVSAEWRFELTDLGSTDVPDPEWLDEAREEGTVTY